MLDGWTYRKQITIDHTKIDSNLTDFPVLVKLNSSNFDFSKARSDGYDIRFCSPDESTLYKYERERHDSSSQVAEYWVKIPSISSSSDTTFWIEYGNAGASDGADPTNAWNSNFKGVYHLKDLTTSTVADSTSNGNNGTKKGANEPIEADAKIGKGQSFDGTDDYIHFGNNFNFEKTDSFTFEFWVKTTDTAAWHYDKRASGGEQQGIEIFTLSDTFGGIVFRAGRNDISGSRIYCRASANINNNNWNYVAITYNGTDDFTGVNFYINGVQSSTVNLETKTGTTTTWINTNNARIGSQVNNTSFFAGLKDELRISNVVRSAAWIKASYHSDNDTLLSFGSEEANNIIFAPVQTITAYSLSPNVFSSITIPVPTQVISFSQFIPDILSKWRGILKHKTLWSGISKHSSSWDNLAKSSAPYLWSSGYYPWGSDKYPWLKYGGFQTIKKS